MLPRLFMFLFLVPVAIVLVTLAVANRMPVPFTVDPFNPGNPALTMELPLFVWLLAALMAGVLLGSLATWLRQAHYRRAARANQRKAALGPPNAPAGTRGPGTALTSR